MRSLFFPQNINGVLTSRTTRHSVRGGGMERAIILRVAGKKCFAPALNISREGGDIFFKFSRKLAIFGTL